MVVPSSFMTNPHADWWVSIIADSYKYCYQMLQPPTVQNNVNSIMFKNTCKCDIIKMVE